MVRAAAEILLIIMLKGKVVEGGEARAVLSAPQHSYSRQLSDAVLSPDLAFTRDRLEY